VLGMTARQWLVRAQGAVNRILAPFDLAIVRRSGFGNDHLLNMRRLLVDEPRIIVDVGAHVGDTCDAFRHAFPSADVLAFEPSPRAAETLSARFAGDPHVEVARTALSDRAGVAPFRMFPVHTADSLLPPVRHGDEPAWLKDCQETTVPTDTLDDVCQRRGIERVDLLKIDTQGADLMVLRGAKGLLAARRIRLVYFEANFERMYEGQASFGECLDLLNSAGYEFVDLYEKVRTRRSSVSYGNALFVAS
jgi:FkbM family methyltransferase